MARQIFADVLLYALVILAFAAFAAALIATFAPHLLGLTPRSNRRPRGTR